MNMASVDPVARYGGSAEKLGVKPRKDVVVGRPTTCEPIRVTVCRMLSSAYYFLANVHCSDLCFEGQMGTAHDEIVRIWWTNGSAVS